MTAAGQIKKRTRFNSETLTRTAKQLAISAGRARATVEPTLTPAGLGGLCHG